MERKYTYDAFISYRHMEFDKAVADKLQKLLEKYIPPASIVPKSDRKKLRLFRDETELASSSNLNDEIKRALETSRFLIVICSKATKDSQWCQQEIEYFKELNGGSVSNILTLLIEGEPSEVFPEELRYETYTHETEDGNVQTETKAVEPLATNISAPTAKKALKRLNQEYLRLVAPLLSCRFDDLFNRNQRRRNRRNMLVAAMLIVALVLFGIYSNIMMFQINTQRAEAQKNYEEAEVQRLLALTNLEEAETQRAEAETQREEAELQRALAMDNLEEVKMLLLSNAIDYAERLNEQGARSRAGAVLQRVYENIDENHEDAESLYARFRDVALDTLYYNDRHLPFARLNLSGEILQISVAAEYGFFVVTTEKNLYKLDLSNGDILKNYPAPEGTFYQAVTNHGRYIFAITDDDYIIVIDSETNERVYKKTFFGGIEIWGQGILFNEEISALIVRIIESITDEEEGGADKNELLNRVTLAIIPVDLLHMQFGEDYQSLIFYVPARIAWQYNMGLLDSSSSSDGRSGRFVTLSRQYRLFEIVENGERTGFHTKAANSYIQVLDLNKFDSSLTPIENKQRMESFIDFRKNDEDLFIIGTHRISPQGILKVDGWSWEEDEQIRLIPRTMVFSLISGTLIFNEQMDGEYIYPTNGQGRIISWREGESIISLGETSLFTLNQRFNYEVPLHLIQTVDGFLALDKSSPDYSFVLEKVMGSYDVGIEEEIFYKEVNSDHRLLSLSQREEETFVRVYCLRSSGFPYWEYRIPDDFSIEMSFLYEETPVYGTYNVPIYDIINGERFIVGDRTLVLVGQTGGNNRIITLNMRGRVGNVLGESQTLDVKASAGAMDRQSGKLIIGHLDGTLLMYNFGRTHYPKRDEVMVRRVRGCCAVYEGHISTGVTLEKVDDENSIFPISYNRDRTLVMGVEAEQRFDIDRIYNIWCLKTGEIIQSFDLGFAIRELRDGRINRFEVQVNSDFTYAIVSTFEYPRRYFYILDVNSDDILYEYSFEIDSGDIFDDIFFGVSDEPYIIWLFHVKTLLLEIIDVAEGGVIRQKNVSERIRGHGGGIADLLGRTAGYYRSVYYDIGSDLIVFRGSADQIYSVSSRRSIFLGDCFACGRGDAILEVNSDGSAVYLHGSLLRIELEPEALFNALRQSPLIGTMTEEDIRATRLDIFE